MGGDLYSISTCWLHGQLVVHRRLLPVVCLYTICTALCCALLKMETMWKRVKRCARVRARAPLVCVPPICWIEIEFWKYDWASCTRCHTVVVPRLSPTGQPLLRQYLFHSYCCLAVDHACFLLLLLLSLLIWESSDCTVCVCAVHIVVGFICLRFRSVMHYVQHQSTERKVPPRLRTIKTQTHTHTPDNKLNQFPR